MCGIIGVILANTENRNGNGTLCSTEIHEGLSILQHRGQDAAGIVTNGSKGRLYQCKGTGMVRDIFTTEQLLGLVGNQGIGHGKRGNSR